MLCVNRITSRGDASTVPDCRPSHHHSRSQSHSASAVQSRFSTGVYEMFGVQLHLMCLAAKARPNKFRSPTARMSTDDEPFTKSETHSQK